jgi:hypothetical protein
LLADLRRTMTQFVLSTVRGLEMTNRYGAKKLVSGRASAKGIALAIGVVFAALLLFTPILWSQETNHVVGTAAHAFSATVNPTVTTR